MERMDRRGDAQPRPLTLIPNFVETADGSCLITAGKTRVICTASVEEGVPPFLARRGARLGHRGVRHAACFHRTAQGARRH